MIGTRRISIVRDARRPLFWVACPPQASNFVGSVPGAEWDHVVSRWTVPTRSETELRHAVACWTEGVTWSDDHRATTVRCAVCGAPLAASLVKVGDRTHIGCEPAPEPFSEPPRKSPAEVLLW